MLFRFSDLLGITAPHRLDETEKFPIPLGVNTRVKMVHCPGWNLHSGYSRRKALFYNLLSSFATLVGGLLAYFALSAVEGVVPVMLSLAAASMIYVAVADLIPGLHKRAELKATLQQVVLIGLGIASIALAHRLVDTIVG